MKIKTIVQLNNEELKRWNDAYTIICEISKAVSHDCEAKAMIEKAIDCFEEFAEKYMEF